MVVILVQFVKIFRPTMSDGATRKFAAILGIVVVEVAVFALNGVDDPDWREYALGLFVGIQAGPAASKSVEIVRHKFSHRTVSASRGHQIGNVRRLLALAALVPFLLGACEPAGPPTALDRCENRAHGARARRDLAIENNLELNPRQEEALLDTSEEIWFQDLDECEARYPE